ncbi:MAG: YggS family pyridoxal phosphate-dependent enzyme, partial [Mesorhizobium sp.]
AGAVTLVAVSKTFDANDIRPVIEAGQRIFGENRVQEAQGKWPALKEAFPDIELHLIGPLQSNKAKEAVALFDVIESVDREKIAAELAKEIARLGRSPKLYVQVNTGSEPQK